MTRSFHSRVLLVFVGLIVLAQVGTTMAMFLTARRTADALAEQQLSTANRLVQDVFAARDAQYRNSLQALAGDFAFREAVSSHDSPTIASALANHGARISADLVVLLDNAGQLVASTDVAAAPPSLLQVMNSARDQPHAPSITSYKGQLIQVVVVPIRAPDTIGWVGTGFIVRDFVVDQIKMIAGVDVSFSALAGASRITVSASTLSHSQRAALDEQVAQLVSRGADAQLIGLDGEDYLTRVVPVVGANGQPFFALLQLPHRLVTAPLVELRERLLLWAGGVTVLCLLAAVFSARLLARPIQALASVARNLRVTKRGEERRNLDDEDEVSSLAGAFQTLAQRTQYDTLTGLPNRTLLSEWLSSSISRAEREKTPLAVVVVDLNGFKQINENLGRAMGDLVLRKTAQRLLRCLRATDILARLGSDEFVLVLEGVTQGGALETINRLMPVIAKPMQSPYGPVQVSMRAGISIFPDHARDRESLLQLADNAKYASKSRGESSVIAQLPEKDGSATMNTAVSAIRSPFAHDTYSGAPWEGDDLATQPMKPIKKSDNKAS
jgi:diguanylate cyclase (GGDEF)-like protein